jgi:hypothetical protein
VKLSGVWTVRTIASLFLCFTVLNSSVYAQEGSDQFDDIIVDRETVAIPLQSDLISLDGDLSDWESLPRYYVDEGTSLSPIAGENDYFEFSVAADSEYFYIMMTTPDHVRVTGQHDGTFWNEDSFEFYLNLTGNLHATEYDWGIFQINLNPGDIGNENPDDITVTGLWSDTAQVRAFVFETADGWGVEASVAWETFGYVPEPGAEIGFNANLNGAVREGGRREAKLIWAKSDYADHSWFDPSVFGTGVFVELSE